MYSAVVDSSWDGKRVGETIDTKWEFPGALLYAVTAITTIGQLFSQSVFSYRFAFNVDNFYIQSLYLYMVPN